MIEKELADMIETCLDESMIEDGCLTPWEKEFVESINVQYNDEGLELSGSQTNVLKKIFHKILMVEGE